GRRVPAVPPVVGQAGRPSSRPARDPHVEPRAGAAQAMSQPRFGNTSAVALAVATAAGNILAYVFTIAMSRLLGVRDFGELGTLLGIWLIAQIPAVACQLTAARALAGTGIPGGGGTG